MQRRLAPLVLLVPCAVACSLVANLGDRTLATDDGGAPTADPTTTATTPPTGSIDPGPPPSYCTGITLYATFDAKLEGDVGGATTTQVGGVSRTQAGKFGGALSLLRTPSTVNEGAALFYTGNPWPRDAGSIALWFRVAPGATPEIPVLYRPIGSAPAAPLVTSGLTFYLRNDIRNQLGLYEEGGGDAANEVLTFDVANAAPFLRTNDYNHYFASWRQGTAPTAFIALNGGLGAVLGTPTDAVYPDAGTNGELRVPYRGFTSLPWIPGAEPTGLRLGGPGNNAPEGFYDDLVIWNRVVSFEELAALYGSGKSVGEACKIP